MEATTISADTQEFNIDASHSQVSFSVRHLGFSKVRGRFEGFSGSLSMERDDLGTLRATASIDVATVNTGDEKRDGHLRSGDFFDAESQPTMTFRSLAARNVTGASMKLDGELTLRDTTRPVTLDVEFLGTATDPWGGSRIALEASTVINRKDFGLNWNTVLETGGVLVGEDVTINLEIQGVLSA